MIQQTIDKLYQMKLGSMARAFEKQISLTSSDGLSFEERFSMIVEHEYLDRENKKLTRRLKSAKLKREAAFENIDFRYPRNVNKSVIMSLGSCEWIRKHHNVVIVGPTGIGKSYLSEAIANKACREGFTALSYRSTHLFRDLEIGKGDGTYSRLFKKLRRVDILLIDDFLINPMVDGERRDLLEIMEERYESKSTVLTSQYPIADWHQLIGAPTHADAILDRIIHNSHKIELKGESMRRFKSDLKK